MTMGRTQLAGAIPHGPLAKGPQASGALEDAKFYELRYSIAAGASQSFDLDATAFYVDNATTVTGEMEFTVDDCFPNMTFRYALFVRLRRFRRIRLFNLSGATQTGRLIYSTNPDFLVLQSQI